MSTDAPAPARSLRILAADEDKATLASTARVLEELGHEVTALAETVEEACRKIERDEPDASIVVVHDDPDHALDLIEELVEVATGPVVVVRGTDDPAFIEAAAARGISAVARSANGPELQAALEVAMRRGGELAQLTEQVGQLEHALERRAVIERAKGILMERHDMTERAAFEALRAHARSESRQVVAVARAVCDDGLDLPRG